MTGVAPAQVAAWAEALPYPLASTLHLYRVRRDPEDRVEALLHFYEGAAQMVSAILVGPAIEDDRYLELAQPGIARAVEALRRASFGTWVALGGYSAGSLRKLPTDAVLRLFESTDPARVEPLTRATAWGRLDPAGQLRNRISGHGPVVTPGKRRQDLIALEELLSPTVDWLIAIFAGWDLVRPGLLAKRGDRYHQRAELLAGVTQPFAEVDLVLAEPLETGALYLVEPGASRGLRVPPLVELVTDEERYFHACYFYSRVSGGQAHWVSRHVGASPTLATPATKIETLIAALQRVPLPSEAPDTSAAPPRAPVSPLDRKDDDDHRPDPRPAAQRLYELLRRIDPRAEGLSVAAITEAVRSAGVDGPAADLTDIGSLLNTHRDRFQRLRGEGWTWVPLDPTLVAGLHGAGLRAEAYTAAQRLDPSRTGLRPDDLAAELTGRGVVIRGPSTVKTLWLALASPAAGGQFRRVPGGRFAWIDEVESALLPSVDISLRPDALPERLRHPASDIDAALRDLVPHVGSTILGDELTWFLDDAPILAVRLDDAEPTATIELRLASAPHVRGVFLRESVRPGVANGDGPIVVRPIEARDWAGVIRLSAVALAHAAGNRARSPRAIEWSLEAISRWVGDLAPPFEHGFGWSGRPSGAPPADGWPVYWAAVTSHLPSDHPMRARLDRYGTGPSFGSDGQDGMYRAITTDRYGVLAHLWFSDLRATAEWLDTVEASRAAIEARLGQPAIWFRPVHRTLSILVRATRGGGPPDPGEAREVATALIRLEDAMAPWIEQLPERQVARGRRTL